MTLKKPICKRLTHGCLKAPWRRLSVRQEGLLRISPTWGAGSRRGRFGTEEHILLALPSGLVAQEPEVANPTAADSLELPNLLRCLGVLGKMEVSWGPMCHLEGPSASPLRPLQPCKRLAWPACGSCHIVSGAEAWPGPEQAVRCRR